MLSILLVDVCGEELGDVATYVYVWMSAKRQQNGLTVSHSSSTVYIGIIPIENHI